MQANIFSIEKYAVSGGRGIRTVVFFKGCPLRCPWCSYPESQSRPSQILWDSKACFYGHLCELRCPTGSIKFEDHVLHYNQETCLGCLACVAQCPTKALEFAGNMMDVDDVMAEIAESREFYKEPGGGVTLSGGEVLGQPEFAGEILKRCRELSIPTVLETSGFAAPLTFLNAIQNADQILFSIKHHDNKEHIKYTGVSQGKILANLDSAVLSRVPVTVAIPVIPGVNSTLEDAKQFAQLLTSHRVTAVTLLPFQKPAEKKCDAPNPACQPWDCKILRPEELEEYSNVFRNAGFDVAVKPAY